MSTLIKTVIGVISGIVGVMCFTAEVVEAQASCNCAGSAWSETAGWLSFNPCGGGAVVHDRHLSGWLWGENIGWVKLGADGAGPYANTGQGNWGVNRDVNGGLSGFAWSETAGWIRFQTDDCQARIDPQTGQFSGHAWAENLGFIQFQGPGALYAVSTSFFSALYVPALGPAGMIVLLLVLGAFSLWMVRRERGR